MKEAITSDRAPAPGGPYSAALAVDGWIFLAGQGGTDPVTGSMADGIEAQTEQVFRNVAALLEEAGASLDDVVSCLVHLTDLAHFPAFNVAYARQFPGIRPVRTTVRADLLAGMLVEVTVVARRRG